MALKKDEILGEWKFEEEFLLRVRDSNLANKIRRILREEEQPSQYMSIEFEGSLFFFFWFRALPCRFVVVAIFNFSLNFSCMLFIHSNIILLACVHCRKWGEWHHVF